MGLPAGFEQIELFAAAEPASGFTPTPAPVTVVEKPKRHKQQKQVFRCCHTVVAFVPVVWIICKCGRHMKEVEG